MTYTWTVAAALVAALVLDLAVLRTRLVRTRQWWAAYGIVLVFQLLTNGWLTGRGVVRYDPGAILGPRVAFAPVEDLGFGFALVLAVTAGWVRAGRTGRTRPGPRPPGRGSAR